MTLKQWHQVTMCAMKALSDEGMEVCLECSGGLLMHCCIVKYRKAPADEWGQAVLYAPGLDANVADNF